MCLIGAVSVLLLRQYIFGSSLFAFNDIGSDTLQLYLEQYGSIIAHIRSGHFSFWDFENGFGANMFLYNMTNPLLMLLYAIGAVFGMQTVPYLMVYLYMAELLLAGLAIYLFLSAFAFDEHVKMLVSLMYAFNGFILVWGQHYQFGIVCILVPLEMLMTERFLRNRRAWKGLSVMTCILVINSMYIAYMTLLCAGVYVLLRLAWMGSASILRYIVDVVHAGGVMLLGVGMGAVNLLPSALAIAKVSGRLGESASLASRLFASYPREFYVTLLGRMLSTTARGINVYDGYKNYYEGPCLFFSTLFLFLMVQYVCLLPRRKEAIRQRLVEVIALFGAAFGILFPFVGVVMNAFVGEFTRFFFLYMVFFALLAARALQEIWVHRRFSYVGFALTTLFLLRFSYTYYYAPLVNPKRTVLLLFVSGMAGGILLMLLAREGIAANRRCRRILSHLLLIMLLVNIGADAWKNFDANSTTELSYSRLTAQKGGEYEQSLFDADTKEAIAQLQKEDGEFFRMEKLYGMTMSMDAMVQGYPSVSSYNSTMNARVAEYVSAYWPQLWCIDQNHFSFYLTEAPTRPDQEALVGIRYILRHEGDAIPEGYAYFRQVGNVIIMKNEAVKNIASFYANETIQTDFSEDGTAGLVMGFDSRDTNTDISMPRPTSEGQVLAKVEAACDGVLFLAIPYEAGWETFVDGQRVEYLLADRGFMGIPLQKGSHEVICRYHAPGFAAGCAMTLLFWLLWIGLLLWEKRAANNQKQKGVAA